MNQEFTNKDGYLRRLSPQEIYQRDSKKRCRQIEIPTGIQWNVHMLSAYWSFQRSAIIKASVGYDQKLNIYSFNQVIKTPFDDFYNLLVETVTNAFKSMNGVNSLGRKFYINKNAILTNRLPYWVRSYEFDFDKESDLESIGDVVKSLEYKNKISYCEGFSISNSFCYKSLILITSAFKERLTKAPRMCRRYINREFGYAPIEYKLERLWDDPDCRDESQPSFNLYTH
ncbi:MAG: hypothetical protein AAFS12_00235 [Cyanobacteria bacterium J06632_19]